VTPYCRELKTRVTPSPQQRAAESRSACGVRLRCCLYFRGALLRTCPAPMQSGGSIAHQPMASAHDGDPVYCCCSTSGQSLALARHCVEPKPCTPPRIRTNVRNSGPRRFLACGFPTPTLHGNHPTEPRVLSARRTVDSPEKHPARRDQRLPRVVRQTLSVRLWLSLCRAC
jgi:hypothetical protein